MKFMPNLIQIWTIVLFVCLFVCLLLVHFQIRMLLSSRIELDNLPKRFSHCGTLCLFEAFH